MFDMTILLLIIFAVLSFVVYHTIKTKLTYKPSEVIIGKQVYIHPETRLCVDVVDFDGTSVYFRLSIESEIAPISVLPKKEFLLHYSKVLRPSTIKSDYSEIDD
jgi:hypothetical protein